MLGVWQYAPLGSLLPSDLPEGSTRDRASSSTGTDGARRTSTLRTRTGPCFLNGRSDRTGRWIGGCQGLPVRPHPTPVRRASQRGPLVKGIRGDCWSPLWVVPKTLDAQGNPRYRVVVDFKELNKYTRPEKYPLPRLVEMLDRMNGATVFSLLDLKAGYHQIRMHEADCEKTAFQFGRGKYEFTRMPFGLRNAPTTFQRLMDEFLEGLNEDAIQVYMDDIIVFSRSEQEHGRHLGRLLHRLKEFGLKASCEKLSFFNASVKFMGHVLSREGIHPDHGKVDAIKQLQEPVDVKVVRSIMGLIGYYRRFLPSLAHRMEGWNSLTKKGATTRRRVEVGPDLPAVPEAAARLSPVSRPESGRGRAEQRRLLWEVGPLNDKARQLSVEIVPGSDVRTSCHRDVQTAMDAILERGRTYYVHCQTDAGRRLMTVLYNTGIIARDSILRGVTYRLTTVEDVTEQDQLIRDYHVGKTNHRGIRETVAPSVTGTQRLLNSCWGPSQGLQEHRQRHGQNRSSAQVRIHVRTLNMTLKTITYNARGLQRQLNEIIDIIVDNRVDVALIAETHLRVAQRLYTQGFKIYRKDRGMSGGGVAIIVRNGIRHQQITVPSTEVEMIGVQVKAGTRPANFLFVY
ncbi:hypothetical protein AAG570_013277 [Ranatra chinensis]|uniref:Reverse transcriptase domain-containing protein n=1 Tax=Ranatra chinensis TaxID=642074 RepID=A0ABD0YIA9_9HEMI